MREVLAQSLDRQCLDVVEIDASAVIARSAFPVR
jgi:hypothetical protein